MSNYYVITLFGTMSQNYYQEVNNYFGINTVKELTHNHFQKFRISYGSAADNYLCRLIFANRWTYSDCTVYMYCITTYAVWYLLIVELILTVLYISVSYTHLTLPTIYSV